MNPELTFLGQPVRTYVSLPSTQDVVRELAEQGAPEGVTVVADEQTAGRGRQGRRWQAPAGSGLLVSVLLRPTIPIDHALRVFTIAPLAAREAIAQVTGVSIGLKWPNDLVTVEGKLGGILSEPSWQGNKLHYIALGFGLNVNLDRQQLAAIETLYPPTSLSELTGHAVDRWQVLRAYLAALEGYYARLDSDIQGMMAEWRQALTTLGQEVIVTTATEQVQGLAETVDRTGALVVRLGDGSRRTFYSGDVSLHGHRIQVAGELDKGRSRP